MAFLPEEDLERMRFFAVKELIKAVKAKKIDDTQLPSIAKDVLDETDNATTPEKLTEALTRIANNHGVLIPISSLYKAYLEDRHAQSSAEELTKLVRSNNLKEAEQLIRTISTQ